MDSNQKAKAARVLGYICLAVGALNLSMAVVVWTRMGPSLLATGFGALTMGIIMVSRGRQKPTPRD